MQKAYDTLEMSHWTKTELLDYQAVEKINLDNRSIENQIKYESMVNVAGLMKK